MTTQNLIWQAGRFRIDLSAPKIMGIVNVTPDSFSDGGRYSSSVSQTLAHAEQLLAEGADMLDIGGESTRPGAAVVSPEEEWARVSPILAELSRWQVPISLDTRRRQAMQQALEAGWVDIINDVQALEDEGAVELLADYPSIGICLMLPAPDTTRPAAPAAFGTEAKIEDFRLEHGALDLHVRGARRFRVLHTRVRDNGLLLGEVEFKPEPAPRPLPPRMRRTLG